MKKKTTQKHSERRYYPKRHSQSFAIEFYTQKLISIFKAYHRHHHQPTLMTRGRILEQLNKVINRLPDY